MGIDRIGKPRPTESPPGGGQTSATRPVERAFSTERAAEARPTGPIASPGPLEQLHAGVIDLSRYLEIKVDEATSHLVGLAPAHLDAIRSALRERLSQDPTLVDLVRRAAGALDVPPSRDE
jgi:hypothetical protein